MEGTGYRVQGSGCRGKANPKSEARNPKSETNSKFSLVQKRDCRASLAMTSSRNDAPMGSLRGAYATKQSHVVKKSLEFDYPRPKGRGITPNSWLTPPRFQKQIILAIHPHSRAVGYSGAFFIKLATDTIQPCLE